MTPSPITPAIQASAVAISDRVTRILTAFVELIYLRFYQDAALRPLRGPLVNYIVGTMRRFQRLMAHVAAGRLPRLRPSGPRHPKPPKPETPGQPEAVRLPWRFGWIITAFGTIVVACIPQNFMAATFGGYLEHVLNQPETADLFAACPQAARILRPLAHMLALRHPLLNNVTPKPRIRKPKPRPEPPPPEPIPPALQAVLALPPGHSCRDYTPSAKWHKHVMPNWPRAGRPVSPRAGKSVSKNA